MICFGFVDYGFMNGFFSSCIPFFQKYAGETVLLIVACVIALVSFIMFIQPVPQKNTTLSRRPPAENNRSLNSIMVEVSGSVVNPGVYKLPSTARLVEALKMAGGISPDADAAFFSRNFNLARYLTDQDKIYIPSLTETQNNLIEEPRRLIDYTAPKQITMSVDLPVNEEESSPISINTASSEELQTLSGIGPATAQKIINARPFITLDELVSNKIVSTKLLDQIKQLIRL